MKNNEKDEILNSDIYPTKSRSPIARTDKHEEYGNEDVRHSDTIVRRRNSADCIGQGAKEENN